MALVAAAEAGVLDIDQAFARMAPQLYGYAARRLGENAVKLAADLFDVAVEKACAQTDIPRLPVVEQPVTESSDENTPLVPFIDERKDNDVREFFERLKETPEEYEARQQRAWHSFSEFSRKLTREDARLILDDLPWYSFKVIVDAEPALAQRWLAALTDASAESLSLLHYSALGVAKACARGHPSAAVHLLQRLSQISPVVNRVFGPGRIPVVAVGIWASADVPEVRQLCFDRLDRAQNDEILASEVLAAFSVGKDALIENYVERLLAFNEPSAIVRARTVCGLSNVNEHASTTLLRYAGYVGFIGNAVRSAQFAYDRNDWSRHWYEKLRTAETPQAFWQLSGLRRWHKPRGHSQTPEPRRNSWPGRKALEQYDHPWPGIARYRIAQ